MATGNGTKVLSYLLVIPSPSPPPSPLPPPPSPPDEDKNDDRKNRRRRNTAASPATTCKCLLSFLAGLSLVGLLCASIAIPVTFALLNYQTEPSTTTDSTTILTSSTTANLTTTSTTSTTSTITTTSTTSSSSTTTTTQKTSTTTTTDISCSSTCTSQQTCVNSVCVGTGYLSCTLMWSEIGDGDIVVATPNNNIIYYARRGPSPSTDYGRLDVDNMNGIGPENVFWTNSSSVPPTGTYYVCFSQFYFSPPASSANPITATVTVVGSGNTTLTFTKTFTSSYTDTSACDSSSDTYLGSFTYP